MDIDGKCQPCQDQHLSITDKKTCTLQNCPNNQAVAEDGSCYYCPKGKGLVPETLRCANCEENSCEFCTTDFKKCLLTDEVQTVVKNAGGHIGIITITLTWSADADLDLWFDCNPDSRVYYARV